MPNQRDALIDTLRGLESLLARHRVSYAKVVSELLISAPTRSEPDIKDDVRQLFCGTMGLLTDIYISKVNGNLVDDETAANAELEAITARLWDLCR
jgi:hypothetical protein